MHACMFIHKYVNICLALLLMTFIIITYIYAHVYEAGQYVYVYGSMYVRT